MLFDSLGTRIASQEGERRREWGDGVRRIPVLERAWPSIVKRKRAFFACGESSIRARRAVEKREIEKDTERSAVQQLGDHRDDFPSSDFSRRTG